MTPDRFIAAAFIELAYEGTNWNLYVTAEFIQRVEQRAAELARESVGDGWKPIETAPKDKRVLLCSFGGAVWLGAWRSSNERPVGRPGWTRFNCDDYDWEPNAWMPLPDPPAKETAWNTRAAGDKP